MRRVRSAPHRPRTSILGAFLNGWRQVLRAPALSAAALAATFLLAQPIWAADYGAADQGLARTFIREFLGFGSPLAIVGDLAHTRPLSTAVASAAAASIAIWVFLSGGFLDRLARGRPVGASHFFAACGGYFVRLARLAVFAGAAYWALFRWLHPYLFDTVYHRALFIVAVTIVNAVADFAWVRAVVEDRRSMIGAIGASIRFIRRRAVRVAGLYLLNAIVMLAILETWIRIAPSAADGSWLALLLGAVYLLARVWARLAFAASDIAFFQAELAHAHYTAAPDPIWPDSPAVEAIENLTRTQKD